jgi:hypothetical protein|tara:strand:+ start:103 stop:306 length:204 start_codon:yes stop_codon:yes gene_type:complete
MSLKVQGQIALLTEKLYKNEQALDSAIAQIHVLSVKIDHMNDDISGKRYAELKTMHELEAELKNHGC